jgi:hypothetical protein
VITLRFEIERQTPGTVRYKEVPEEDMPIVVGTLYVKKGALKGLKSRAEFPEYLEVTIEAADG